MNTTDHNDNHTQRWQGHPISTQHNDLFTICFSNLNGITKGSDRSLTASLKDLTTTLQYYRIALLGVSEHHLALSNPGMAEKIYQFERQMFRTNKVKCFFHSSQETTPDNRKLMGGTGIMALQNTIGRIKPKGSGGDTMGRWSYLHLRLSEGRTLTVISIYQVCITPTNRLGGTAWHQQRRALDRQSRQEEHPREAFMKDLTELIHKFRQQHHEIIVGGDWNETLFGSRSKVTKLCREMGLVDPWLHFHPQHDEFATHERGSQRIDAALVSHSLLPVIESVSYSPVGLLQNNDHRTIFLQMSRKRLFGSVRCSLTIMTTAVMVFQSVSSTAR